MISFGLLLWFGCFKAFMQDLLGILFVVLA
jgi:hypothetical protein